MAKANKIVRNGNNLIVVLGSSGDILTHSSCNDDLYNKIINADTDDEIRNLIEPKKTEVVKKVVEKVKEAEAFESAIRKSKRLSIFHSSVYWKDVCEVSLPRDLAETILTAEQENNLEYLEALKNFWVLCSLNPDSRARNNLFWFLTRYGFKISKNGLFVAYRNVDLKTNAKMTKTVKKVTKVVENESSVVEEKEEEVQVAEVETITQDNTLNAFISSEFTRVRFKLKKAAKNFYVGKIKDEEGKESYISNVKQEKVGEFIGMLDKLYEGLMNAKPEEVIKKVAEKTKKKDVVKKPEVVTEEVEEVVEEVLSAAVYTDSYTKKMTIMIGQTVSIDRSKCNPDQQQTCSHGLHVAGRSWLGDGYLGKISLVTLVNPADVVAVPPEDSYGKMRVCSYFPLAVIERDKNGKLIDPEFENGFDDDFIKVVIDGYSVNNDDTVKNYTLLTPSIYEFDPKKVQRNLEEIKKNLSKKMS